MTGAAKGKSISTSLEVARVLLLLAVTLLVGQTRVWAIVAPPQPSSGQIALASPSSVGEITTAWQYDAPDALLAAKTLAGGSAGGVGGLLMSCESGGATGSYLQDGHGNVCQIVDQSDGSEDVKMEYDAFGRVVVGAPTWALKNAFRFSSKFYDNETGFLYYGHRYYDPVHGRWLNRDPIGEAGGENLYGFNLNDPISLIDPDGHSFLSVAIKKCLQRAVKGFVKREWKKELKKELGEELEDVAQKELEGYINEALRKVFDQSVASQAIEAVPGIGDALSVWNAIKDFQEIKDGKNDIIAKIRQNKKGRGSDKNSSAAKGGLETRGVRPAPGTRVRPEGVPEGWRVRPTNTKGGTEYYNPKNPNESVRVMQGNPNSPYPNSQAPYARQRDAGGTFLRQDGTRSPEPRGGLKDPDAHIPLDQFQFRP